MTDQDRRRDLSKLRTIALSDATHRRLRLYCHGLHEPGEAGETIARVAAQAIGAWLDRQEEAAMQGATYAIAVAPCTPGEAMAGDPSEGVAYDRWRRR